MGEKSADIIAPSEQNRDQSSSCARSEMEIGGPSATGLLLLLFCLGTGSSMTNGRLARTRRATASSSKETSLLEINRENLQSSSQNAIPRKTKEAGGKLDRSIATTTNADDVTDMENLEHVLSAVEAYEPRKIGNAGKRKIVDTFNNAVNDSNRPREIADVGNVQPRRIATILPQRSSRSKQDTRKSFAIDSRPKSSPIEARLLFRRRSPARRKQTKHGVYSTTTSSNDEPDGRERIGDERGTTRGRNEESATSSTENYPREFDEVHGSTNNVTGNKSSRLSWRTKLARPFASNLAESRKGNLEKFVDEQEAASDDGIRKFAGRNNIQGDAARIGHGNTLELLERKESAPTNVEHRDSLSAENLRKSDGIGDRTSESDGVYKNHQIPEENRSFNEPVYVNGSDLDDSSKNTATSSSFESHRDVKIPMVAEHSSRAASGLRSNNYVYHPSSSMLSTGSQANEPVYANESDLDNSSKKTATPSSFESHRDVKIPVVAEHSSRAASGLRSNSYVYHPPSSMLSTMDPPATSTGSRPVYANGSDLDNSSKKTATPSSFESHRDVKIPMVAEHSSRAASGLRSNNYVYHPSSSMLSTATSAGSWTSEPRLRNEPERSVENVETTTEGDGKYESQREGRQVENHEEYIHESGRAPEGVNDRADVFKKEEVTRHAVKYDVRAVDDVASDGSHDSERHRSAKEGATGRGGKFEKGGATEREQEHRENDDEKGEKGYESWHEEENANKGHHDKEQRSNYYDEKDGKVKEGKQEGGYHEEHQEGEKGEKQAEFDEKGKHQKGYNTKGQHFVHKKDEFEKRTEFFDESHEDGDAENNGGFHHERKMSKSGDYKAGHHDADDHEQMFGKKGEHEESDHHRDDKGHEVKEGVDSHHEAGNMHGEKKSHRSGKEWMQKEGDGADEPDTEKKH